MGDALVRQQDVLSLHRASAEQLEKDRRRNDLRLKGIFESIFDKYTKDFSETGDEIDLETGQIVVNNGHLAHMTHERDMGLDSTRRHLRPAAERLEDQAMRDRSSVDTESDDDELAAGHKKLVKVSRRNRFRSRTTPFRPTQGRIIPDSDASQESDIYAESAVNRLGDQPSSNYRSSSTTVTDEILNGVHTIGNSLGTLARPQLDQSHTINPGAIQALGQNIATQIAQFLTQHVSINTHHGSNDPWSVPPLPANSGRFFQRPVAPSDSPAPARLQSPNPDESLWAMVSSQPRPRGRPAKRQKQKISDDARLRRSRPEESIVDEPVTSQMTQQSSSSKDTNVLPETPVHGIEYGLEEENDMPEDLLPDDTQLGVDTAESIETREPNRRRKAHSFTKSEDATIKYLRETWKLPWIEIARRVPGITADIASQRYNRYLRDVPFPRTRSRITEILDDQDQDLNHNEQGGDITNNMYSRALDDGSPAHYSSGDSYPLGMSNGDASSRWGPWQVEQPTLAPVDNLRNTPSAQESRKRKRTETVKPRWSNFNSLPYVGKSDNLGMRQQVPKTQPSSYIVEFSHEQTPGTRNAQPEACVVSESDKSAVPRRSKRQSRVSGASVLSTSNEKVHDNGTEGRPRNVVEVLIYRGNNRPQERIPTSVLNAASSGVIAPKEVANIPDSATYSSVINSSPPASAALQAPVQTTYKTPAHPSYRSRPQSHAHLSRSAAYRSSSRTTLPRATPMISSARSTSVGPVQSDDEDSFDELLTPAPSQRSTIRVSDARFAETPTDKSQSSGMGWTPQEEATILELRRKGMGWIDMVPMFPERSRDSIRNHFRYTPHLREAVGVPQVKQRPKWNAVEDAVLLDLLSQGTSWVKIARSIPGRSATGCQRRYEQYLVQAPSSGAPSQPQAMRSSIDNSGEKRITRWLPEEDNAIIQLRDDGLNWSDIEFLVPGRSASSCNHRMQHIARTPSARSKQRPKSDGLTPEAIAEASARKERLRLSLEAYAAKKRLEQDNGTMKIETDVADIPVEEEAVSLPVEKGVETTPAEEHPSTKGKWTPEEDAVLIELRGNGVDTPWSSIARMLPGRTVESCRKRFHKYLVV